MRKGVLDPFSIEVAITCKQMNIITTTLPTTNVDLSLYITQQKAHYTVIRVLCVRRINKLLSCWHIN